MFFTLFLLKTDIKYMDKFICKNKMYKNMDDLLAVIVSNLCDIIKTLYDSSKKDFSLLDNIKNKTNKELLNVLNSQKKLEPFSQCLYALVYYYKIKPLEFQNLMEIFFTKLLASFRYFIWSSVIFLYVSEFSRKSSLA